MELRILNVDLEHLHLEDVMDLGVDGSDQRGVDKLWDPEISVCLEIDPSIIEHLLYQQLVSHPVS